MLTKTTTTTNTTNTNVTTIAASTTSTTTTTGAITISNMREDTTIIFINTIITIDETIFRIHLLINKYRDSQLETFRDKGFPRIPINHAVNN